MKKRHGDGHTRRRMAQWAWPVTLLTTALLMAGGSYYLSQWWGGQLDREHNMQKRALDRALGRHLNAVEEVEIARSHAARYHRLQAQGLIGELDRLVWSDGFRAIGEELALADISLQFSAREPLDRDLKRRFGAVEPIYSQFGMRLSFKAQHEGDLLTILRQLDQRITPMYFVEQCALQAQFPEDRRPAFSRQGNVETACQLQLLQVLPRERRP
ncbi:MAG: hypothetical protein OIF57_17185 [Marinobacterium sp.]|nr:hypothetical protein [Marinobacterium sp.]